MSRTAPRVLLLAALIAACAHSETSSGTTTSTANGTLAMVTMPKDSISDRADRGRIAGDSTATVWLIMASDFQCPYCKQWHDAAFTTIMQEYAAKGRIRMAFLNFPLSMHPNAVPASEAAMCASVQNKFWPMHEALFAAQDKWAPLQNPAGVFDSLATTVGLNMTQFRQCMSQHLTLPLIQADHDRARQSGVGSTPTFFIGNQMLSGADKDIRAALDAALAKPGKKPAS